MTKISLTFLALLLLACPALAGDLPDFSSYPQTAAFHFFLAHQTNGTAQLGQSNLLAITKFIETEKVAVVYGVTQDGHENDSRWVYEWAMQASHAKRLSDDDLNQLRAAIGKLPARNDTPPIRHLVMVSFQAGTNWVTRTYDGRKLPEAMTQIFGMIGTE